MGILYFPDITWYNRSETLGVYVHLFTLNCGNEYNVDGPI